MKSLIKIVALALIVVVGGLWTQHWIERQLPVAKCQRLLAGDPESMVLKSPLWDYRHTFKPEWTKVGSSPDGVQKLSWEGYLDINHEMPRLEGRSAEVTLPLLNTQAWNEGQDTGLYYELGEENILLPSYFFEVAHQSTFAGPIPWDDPLVIWEAQALQTNPDGKPPVLHIAFDDVWETSCEIHSKTWETYHIRAHDLPAGDYILALQSGDNLAAEPEDHPRQFFVRNLRVAQPLRLAVALNGDQEAPEILFNPSNPVQTLLANGTTQFPIEQDVPWSVYDENTDLVTPVEFDGLVRTALFLPPESEWRLKVEPAYAQRLVCYPVVRHPEGAPIEDARVRLEIQLVTDQTQETLLDAIIKPDDYHTWEQGLEVVLPEFSEQPTQLVFRTRLLTPSANTPVVPFYLGDPCLLPAHNAMVASHDQQRPDVVMVSLDTLRADAVTLFGCSQPTTPWMQSFFQTRGVVYDHVSAAASWTLPSHASLFLSQYVSRHGVIKNYDIISNNVTMLAELFAQQGYQTAAFVDASFVNYRYGFHQGFQTFDQKAGNFRSILPRCQEFLRKRDQRVPLFLFLHTFDVHEPYTPPHEFARKFLSEEMQPDHPGLVDGTRHTEILHAANMGKLSLTEKDARYLHQLYLAEVNYVDQMMEEFFPPAMAEGLLMDPLIMMFADHGEAFQEHGQWQHGLTLYEEELHVPLMVRFPGDQFAGQRVGSRASLVDLPPTLAGYLGWPMQPEWQGYSLVPELSGSLSSEEQRRIYAEISPRPAHWSAVYDDQWKYIETREEVDYEQKTMRLLNLEAYDLNEDPVEQNNLAAVFPEATTKELQAMSNALAEMVSQRHDEGSIPMVSIDPDTFQRLKALGYFRNVEGIKASTDENRE